MDICVISNLFPPEVVGGAEKHAKADVNELVNRGHDVSVITTRSSSGGTYFSFEESELGGATVYRFTPLNAYSPIEHQSVSAWKKPIQHVVDIWNPHVYLLVKKKLCQISPDIVHIHNHSGLSPSVFAAVSSHEIPVVHTLHDYEALHVRTNLFDGEKISDPGIGMKPYQKIYRQLVEPHLDYVVSPSQFVLEKHHSEGVYSTVPCSRVPLGISSKSTDSVSSRPSNSDQLQLMFAGQHTHQKGIDILIKAVRKSSLENLHLNIYGKGPESSKLEDLASDEPRITFHGFVDDEELQDAYAASHFTVVPSRWYDNSPMVIYESYNRGTPVIGANIGGIPELITDGETGILFAPNDVDSLQGALERAASLPYDEIQTQVEETKSYCISNHIDEIISIYEDILR
ncbi:Glycosyltransferase involved in cell wall bisynthesis [Halogranum rubrum]|uniref:Glycosyltransferase involved in cell wall bisynthesis n=1 Tax=Halogranum rubrum TaxID=553466 RepID=A0A1I4B985_9EURY|nr:glycosyltransferase family 4 protein [Halogranum rubrum]SFK65405.1 Glycosyltransferase involved in cell wall bisynthesis [Halogranum rubrum]